MFIWPLFLYPFVGTAVNAERQWRHQPCKTQSDTYSSRDRRERRKAMETLRRGAEADFHRRVGTAVNAERQWRPQRNCETKDSVIASGPP